MSSAGLGIQFDILNDGKPKYMQWVNSGTNDAFLAYDLNENGIVDNGGELFGVGTEVATLGRNAINGYEALIQFDAFKYGGNGDRKIDEQDAIWSDLYLWNDSNGDGISVAQEMTKISASKLIEIDLNYRITDRVDVSGNPIPYWSWIKTNDARGPKRVKMIDVFFLPL